MSYFVIEDFRQGLDRRKHTLASPPGTLFAANNVNITRGGEVEAAKAFVNKYALPGGATFGLLSAGGKLYTFGSGAPPAMPAGILYQRLQHPSGTNMTGIVHASVVKGKPFVIAKFVGGLGVFNNGTVVNDWLPSTAALANYNDVAAAFATAINANGSYNASAAGAVVTITGQGGVMYSVAATALNGGGTNDQTATVATSQAAGVPGAETRATATITFSGVTPDMDGDGNQIARNIAYSIQINGVEILGASLYANDDAGAAAAVTSQINSFASSPFYSASASGGVVTLTAPAGSGATLNGVGINFSGTWFASLTAFAGGVSATSGQPQISTVTFAGTFEAADTYSITLAGTVFSVTGTGANGKPASFSLTKDSKTYAIAGPVLFGSKIDDASSWNSGTGSFVTDYSSELQGAETLQALATFMGNLALFSRSTIQIVSVDADPANNKILQVLPNIGTLAPKSVISYGDSDVFFLSDSGLRSLKIRAISDTAAMSDIGSPIDPVIIDAIKAAGASAANAVSVMEPVDGRFILQIGTVTYVFHYFPAAKISAWTTYQTGLAFTDFAVLQQRLYARAGDNVYLLGGDNNDAYTSQPFDVTIPFLSAHQLATLKHFTALDVACDGTFDVYIATDPKHPSDQENIATICGSTLGLGVDPFQAEDVSAISLRFVGRSGKYGRIANLTVHYEPLGEAA